MLEIIFQFGMPSNIQGYCGNPTLLNITGLSRSTDHNVELLSFSNCVNVLPHCFIQILYDL